MKTIKNKFLVALFILLIISTVGCKNNSKKEFNVEEIKKISSLETFECTFKTVADIENKVPLFGSAKYFVQYNAIIRIGIDMKEIEYDENRRILYIPKAKVTSYNYDVNSIDEKSKDHLWFSIGRDKQQELIKSSLEDLVKNIENNNDLLKNAQPIAENQLSNIINRLYTIAGKEPDITYAYK